MQIKQVLERSGIDFGTSGATETGVFTAACIGACPGDGSCSGRLQGSTLASTGTPGYDRRSASD